MKILLDECTPRLIKLRLPHRDIETVQERGWAGIKNGELLRLADEHFEVFITTDQKLRYQQNLMHRNLAIIVLPSNQVPIVEQFIAATDEALTRAEPGSFIDLPLPQP